ncbi:MAG: type IV toxin-antitoxin system AbiEi family antitoxin [Candidatus Micrarchaeia archaeon]|jgi:predicted transcriptional regulator of viral defense system
MNTKTIIIRKGLSAAEAKAISDLASEGKTIFSIDDLAKKVGSRQKARKLASNAARKGWLERISKGTYLVMELGAGSKPVWTADSFFVASKLSPVSYYIGYYNMLSEYGWTEQVPLSVFIATTGKMNSRLINGVKYQFVSITERKFFGNTTRFVRGNRVIVSDPEKTLVDALDHPEYCGGIVEVAKCLLEASKTIDLKKLISYAELLGNSAVFKRLGYLAEVLGITLPMDISGNVAPGYSYLLPHSRKKGKHNSRWNLIINEDVSKETVLA